MLFTPPYIIVAFDNLDYNAAIRLAQQLNPAQCRLKIGKELFTAYGPAVVEALMQLNFEIFLDLKFHDIPNTVAKACLAAARLGVWMVDVHILGGIPMLMAAREAIDKATHKPLLVGITCLTSLTDQDLSLLGFHRTLPDQVMLLAQLAHQTRLDGVVCSPQEITLIRQSIKEKFCLVTPGIRLPYSSSDDQKRTLTPKEAFTKGSDYLVVGRPITQASDPNAVLHEILTGSA